MGQEIKIRKNPQKTGKIRKSKKNLSFLIDFHSLTPAGVFSISHTLKLFVQNVHLRIREDEDIAFCISRSRRVSFNRKLNSFFGVHQPQSGAMKIVFFHASEINEQCKSISSVEVGCIQRTVFFPESSENFLPKISRFYSLTVNFIQNSIHSNFYLRYVRIKCFFLNLSLLQRMARKKGAEVPSLIFWEH